LDPSIKLIAIIVLLIKIRHGQIEMSIESAKRRLYATDNGISHRDQYILKRDNSTARPPYQSLKSIVPTHVIGMLALGIPLKPQLLHLQFGIPLLHEILVPFGVKGSLFVHPSSKWLQFAFKN
jgi:hypothetical protein